MSQEQDKYKSLHNILLSGVQGKLASEDNSDSRSLTWSQIEFMSLATKKEIEKKIIEVFNYHDLF